MPPPNKTSPQQAAQLQRVTQLIAQLKYEEAEALLREAVRRDPSNEQAQFLTAQLHCGTKRYDSALYMIDKLLAKSPDVPMYQFERASALMGLKRRDEGVEAYTKLVERNPRWLGARVALAMALHMTGDIAKAIEHLMISKPLAVASGDPSQVYEVCGQLVRVLSEAGYFEQAVRESEEVARANPGEVAIATTRAFLSNYLDNLSAVQSAQAHKAVHEIYYGRRPKAAPPQTPKNPERKLRVGLISPDFCDHSVSYFAGPLIRGLDRTQFEVWCYNSADKPDEVTEQLKKSADQWREVKTLSNGDLAARMRGDEIDIAIDMAGLTRGTRISALFGGSAPVQATWCGYPNTTAIPGVQYRIVDAVTDPPWSDALHTEKLVRLKGCFLCYDPGELPPLAPVADGPIVFTSFNAINKISPTTAQLWATVLREVPGSRLLLKNSPFKYESVRERYRKMLESLGAPAGSIDFADYVKSRAEHLALYGKTHIALDTTPYNGTTTSCEALVMGVPLVTMQLDPRRDRHAARVSQSILRTIGAPELIAANPEEFVKICRELAADRGRLENYRTNLRTQMLSTLGNQEAFARDFGEALREMWKTYCATA